VQAYLSERNVSVVPTEFVFLEELPTTAVGNTDEHALVSAVDAAVPPVRMIAPRTWIESKLFEIWASLMGRSNFGVDDDLFELGGHSLLATQILARAQETFGIEIPLSVLWTNEFFTIANLAATIQQKLIEENSPENVANKLTNSREPEEQTPIPLSRARSS